MTTGTARSNSGWAHGSPYSPWAQAGGLVVSLLAVLVVATIGNLAAMSSGEQYDRLDTPAWAPPGWLFGPVWTVLYLLIAVSAWLVWRGEPWRAVRTPIAWHVVALVLNAAWTPLFFGAELRGAAFAEILALIAAIAVTFTLFLRHNRVAAALLIPYLAWTLFAAALTFAVWTMN
ncbi:TspO/MBR family protein [Nocardia takedensis]|uniref:TspO/MBR family protein n=1 Tax=Nocardia takedensis TaxID=259390 RepID=UPI0002EFB26F|nr:TspO/MBR family protein [Nocardia takedensis]